MISITSKEKAYLDKREAWSTEVTGIKNTSGIMADPMDPFSVPDSSGNFLEAIKRKRVKKYLNRINILKA